MRTDSHASAPPPPPSETSSRPLWPAIPLRFSLRTLLIAITIFGVWCALVSLLPQAINELLVGAIWIVATGWLIIGVVFAKDDQRAFCIGALLVVSSMWTGIGGLFMQGFHRLFLGGGPGRIGFWVDLMMLAATAVANGWFCVWARRYFERSSGG